MRTTFALVAALLVTTALVGGIGGAVGSAGGVGGVAAATGPPATTGAAGTTGSTAGPAPAVASHGTDGSDTCAFPASMTDATGRNVTLTERPERITTTNPSAAQTLWELGARDRVVGVTQYASYLDDAGEKTNVSASFGVDVERVVGTEPDLVLAPNASANAVEPLRNAGVTVYHFPAATSVDDIATKTETIGRLIGECAAASDTNAEMYDAVEETRDRTNVTDRPAALYPLGDGYVAAGDTFIDEIMQIGGVENVAAEAGEGYPQLSDEIVLSLDPKLILVTDPDAPILDEKPYASTTAGQEGNAVVMEVHYLNQPAPRSVIESTATLADAVEAYDARDGGDGNDAGASGDAAPGFGVATGVIAVLAALSAALLARRR